MKVCIDSSLGLLNLIFFQASCTKLCQHYCRPLHELQRGSPSAGPSCLIPTDVCAGSWAYAFLTGPAGAHPGLVSS